MKVEWSCEGGGDHRILDGTGLETSFDKCPRKYLSPEVDEILWLWREWALGHGEGPQDRPEGLTEAFKILESLKAILQEQERAKWQRN